MDSGSISRGSNPRPPASYVHKERSKGRMTEGVAYSIVCRLRTPVVNPGQRIEMEVYLSGYGMPKQNKLHLAYSSPYVISRENPGVILSAIAVAKHKTTGQIMQPVSGKPYLQEHKCDMVGATVTLNEGYFLPIPEERAKRVEQSFSTVMSEWMWDGYPPLLVTLNISKTAPAGNHNLYLTLTYGDGHQISQDQKCVTFYVTNWWDRWKSTTTTIGLCLAIPAAAGGIISLITNQCII